MEFLLFILIILAILLLFKVGSVIDNQEVLSRKINLLSQKINEISKESILDEIKKLLNAPTKKEELELVEKKIETPKIPETPVVKEPIKIKRPKIKLEPTPKKPNFFEKIFNSFDFEEWIINNLLLKIGVIIFVLGIGFFLKYSIEENLIPIWMRVAIGIIIGNALIVTGIKMLKQPKFFSASFFGAGIAILYLSIFAGFALDNFKVLDYKMALGAMVVVTIFAGFISVRFNFLSTAIFGLIGGFLTPILINSGSDNINGFLSYILLLNFGILYISIHKRWVSLSWMSFILTMLLANRAIVKAHTAESSSVFMLTIFISLFFIIYSVVPFVNDILEKREKLKNPLIFLFVANFLAVVGSFANLFFTYGIEKIYFSIVTTVLATIFIVFVLLMRRYSLFVQNLLTISLSQSLLLILITPFIIFDSISLTLILALESLILMFIGYRTKQVPFIIFSYIGYFFVSFNLLIDLKDSYFIPIDNGVFKIWINNLTVIGSFFAGWFFLEKIKEVKLFKQVEEFMITQEKIKFIFFFVSFYISFLTILKIGNDALIYFHIGETFFVSFVFIALSGFVWLIRENIYRTKVDWLLKAIWIVFAFYFIYQLLYSLSMPYYTPIAMFIKFVIFTVTSLYIYIILISTSKVLKISNITNYLFIGFAYTSLFIFLNVEIYKTFEHFFSSNAALTSLTFLWVIYAITTMIIALKKEINIAKKIGITLLLIAILKAFFIDLSNAEPIYKIILFIVVGVILFLSSYYYNKLYQQKKSHEK